jgi:uncharacterized phage protein (TIGR01671 family)
MKREIKFRFWSGLKMFYTFEEVMECLKQQLAFNQSIVGTLVYDHTGEHGASFMQYTDLKDKNGKEIYEGDILHCHEYDSSDCGHRITQTFKNAVVGFSDGNYYYYPKGNMQQAHQLLMYAYQPEVIGNIYENPELLIKK